MKQNKDEIYVIGFPLNSSDHKGPCVSSSGSDRLFPGTFMCMYLHHHRHSGSSAATGFRVGLGEKKREEGTILSTLFNSWELISLVPRLESGASLVFVLVHNSVTWPTLESRVGDKEVKNKIRKLTTILVVLQVFTSLPNMPVIVYFQNPQLGFFLGERCILPRTFSYNQWIDML